MVEFDGDVTCDLEVLLLILSHRNFFRLIEENICGHQYGIRKKSMIWRQPLSYFIFIGVAPEQKPHRGDIVEYPGQFRYLRHVRLYPENSLSRIQPQSKEVHSGINSPFGELPAVSH